MTHSYFLFTLIILPLLGAGVIFFVPTMKKDLMRSIALFTSLITFGYSVFLWILFDKTTAQFQFVELYNWLPIFNINIYLGVDGISLFFIILTTFLIPMCILAGWDAIQKNIKEYLIAFLILETMMILVFTVLDILLFYIFFESVLLPMFLLVGIWGSRQRKIHAAIQFFLYTLFGSVFMLLAILAIYINAGTTDLQTVVCTTFSPEVQKFLWIAFFASFSVKIPMVPVHIWLPEAHVEAPTAGSVILAGILLKLGGYGFLRFSMNIFPIATAYFTPIILTFCIIGVIYTSLTTLRQTDFKKVIAYTSVAHMGFVVVGMFACNVQGVEGSVILMLSHGFVSSALFLIVGILYDRHHSRVLKYYCGLTQGMPIYATGFLFFSLANLGLPGTSSFIGEFLVLAGALYHNTTVTVMISTAMVFGAAYSIWLFNRVMMGQLILSNIKLILDVTRREVCVMIPFIILTLSMGIYPEMFIEYLHISIKTLILNARV